MGDRDEWSPSHSKADFGGLGHRSGERAGGPRDEVQHAKPNPDLFLAAANRLGADMADAVVVGDSIWNLLVARALGVGLLSGGYGAEGLERAEAYRVYENPRDMLTHLDEVGFRRR